MRAALWEDAQARAPVERLDHVGKHLVIVATGQHAVCAACGQRPASVAARVFMACAQGTVLLNKTLIWRQDGRRCRQTGQGRRRQDGRRGWRAGAGRLREAYKAHCVALDRRHAPDPSERRPAPVDETQLVPTPKLRAEAASLAANEPIEIRTWLLGLPVSGGIAACGAAAFSGLGGLARGGGGGLGAQLQQGARTCEGNILRARDRHSRHRSRKKADDRVRVRLACDEEADAPLRARTHDAHAVDELVEMIGDQDGWPVLRDVLHADDIDAADEDGEHRVEEHTSGVEDEALEVL